MKYHTHGATLLSVVCCTFHHDTVYAVQHTHEHRIHCTQHKMLKPALRLVVVFGGTEQHRLNDLKRFLDVLMMLGTDRKRGCRVALSVPLAMMVRVDILRVADRQTDENIVGMALTLSQFTFEFVTMQFRTVFSHTRPHSCAFSNRTARDDGTGRHFTRYIQTDRQKHRWDRVDVFLSLRLNSSRTNSEQYSVTLALTRVPPPVFLFVMVVKTSGSAAVGAMQKLLLLLLFLLSLSLPMC